MKNLLLILMFLLCLTVTLLGNDVEVNDVDHWYIGGDLHYSSSKDWNDAVYENRLATAADWIKEVVQIKDEKDWKEKSIQVENCLSKTVKGLKNKKMSELVIDCILKYRFPLR